MARLGNDIALAKGILQGSLSRGEQDLAAVVKEDLAKFHALFEKILSSQASTSEFTDCLAWVLVNIVPSSSRTLAFGKFLAKVSASVVADVAPGSTHVTYSGTADPRKKGQSADGQGKDHWYSPGDVLPDVDLDKCAARLVILQFLDAIFKSINQSSGGGLKGSREIVSTLRPHILDIVRQSAPTKGKDGLEIHHALSALMRTWKRDDVCHTLDLVKIRAPARQAYQDWLKWLQRDHQDLYRQLCVDRKDTLQHFEVQKYHGDHDDPWHHLPVGTMLSLVRGRQPISTSRMRPVRLPEGPIDPELISVVTDHISEANAIFSVPKAYPYPKEEDLHLNGLGLRTVKDPKSGKRTLAETYYGFSPNFTAELKRRRKNPAPDPSSDKPSIPKPPHASQPSMPSSTPSAQSMHATPFKAQDKSRPPQPPQQQEQPLPPQMQFQIPPPPPSYTGPWPPPPPPPPSSMDRSYPAPPPHPSSSIQLPTQMPNMPHMPLSNLPTQSPAFMYQHQHQHQHQHQQTHNAMYGPGGMYGSSPPYQYPQQQYQQQQQQQQQQYSPPSRGYVGGGRGVYPTSGYRGERGGYSDRGGHRGGGAGGGRGEGGWR